MLSSFGLIMSIRLCHLTLAVYCDFSDFLHNAILKRGVILGDLVNNHYTYISAVILASALSAPQFMKLGHTERISGLAL